MYFSLYPKPQQNTNRSLHSINLSPLHPICPQQEKNSISCLSQCLHQKFRQVTFACHPPTSSNLPKLNILAKSLSNPFTPHHFPVPTKSSPHNLFLVSSVVFMPPLWAPPTALHTAARLINLKCKSCQSTHLLKSFQWLPMFLA